MDTTLFLAKFWGFFMLIFSIIFILSPKTLDKLFEYVKDEKLLFLLGLFSFFIGLGAVLLHNKWSNAWQITITLFGWFALLKGILRLTNTLLVSKTITSLNVKGIRWLLAVVLIMATVLLYYAYFIHKT